MKTLLTTVAALTLVPAALANAPKESALLQPLGGSAVGGRITYQASGEGTRAWARLTGLRPGAKARILLNAGTCAAPGASFAELRGGRIVFRGEPVGIGTVADGSHVLSVVVDGKRVACAAIPGMD